MSHQIHIVLHANHHYAGLTASTHILLSLAYPLGTLPPSAVERSNGKPGETLSASPCTASIVPLSTTFVTYLMASSTVLVHPNLFLWAPHPPLQGHLEYAPTVKPPGAEWSHGSILLQMQARNMEFPPLVVPRRGHDWTPTSSMTLSLLHSHLLIGKDLQPMPSHPPIKAPTRSVDCRHHIA